MIRIVVTLVCLFLITSTGFAAHVARPDPAQPLGVWEGWGCSLSWWANAFGSRDDMADALFTTKDANLKTDAGSVSLPGLGLSVVHYNIGGTSRALVNGKSADIPDRMPRFRQIEGFWLNGADENPDSQAWDWGADANQRAMLQKAKARGVMRVEAFSNAPMWWMLKNNSTAGSADGGNNLIPGQERNFARYLATVAKHAKDKWGVTFDTVEPFNEPSANWWKHPSTQEGCHFDVATQQKVIAAVREELDARGLRGVGIAASDENSVDDALKTWNAFDAATRKNVTRVNVHGYSGLDAYRGPNRAALREALAKDAKILWNSEYGENDASGRTMARSILLDINESHVRGWVYWQPFDKGGWGLVDADAGAARIGAPNPKYHVLAQFSRHIRPGMTIINSGDADTVSAYDPTNGTVVAVTLNDGPARWQHYDLSLFGGKAATAKRWSTSTDGGARYRRYAPEPVIGNTFRSWLPANTVQTTEFQATGADMLRQERLRQVADNDILKGAKRLICVGASMTEQGDAPKGWVTLIREALKPRGIEVINAGVSGNRSRDVLARFQKDVLDRKPDVVLTCFGVNDVWHGINDKFPQGGGPNAVPVDEYRANMRQMILQMKDAGIRPALFTMTMLGEDPNSVGNRRLAEYVKALHELADENDCFYVDVFHPYLAEAARLREKNNSKALQLSVDGVHMTDLGNAFMARLTLEAFGVEP